MKSILLIISSLALVAVAQTTAATNQLAAATNTFCAVAVNQQINSQQVVDTNRFTQLLSNHLLLDHFDKAYLHLSKKISFQFRDAIQVRVKKVKSSNNNNKIKNNKNAPTKSRGSTTTTTTKTTVVMTPPVDVQILKRQLKGAVGSFVEDKLPTILTNRYNTTSLQVQLDILLNQYCPSSHDKKQCLLNNRHLFLQEIHHYTINELQSALLKVNEFDLPRLFEKTRAQISGILIHFNQHTMDKEHHRLELKIKSAVAPNLMAVNPNQQQKSFSSSVATTTRNWITSEMIQEFIAIVNHTDYEEEGNTSIQHFLDLST